MKTTRLISTISYNSLPFLERLFSVLERDKIEWAHYIQHRPEADGEKPHFHILLQPARSLDTKLLSLMFLELRWGEEKPVGVMPWRTSKLDDWLLYAVHDTNYLSAKGQSRKYHYDRSDIRTTSPELLAEQWGEINLSKYGIGAQLREAWEKGLSWQEVLASGVIPQNGWSYWKEFYYSLIEVGVRGSTGWGRSPQDPAARSDGNDLRAAGEGLPAALGDATKQSGGGDY